MTQNIIDLRYAKVELSVRSSDNHPKGKYYCFDFDFEDGSQISLYVNDKIAKSLHNITRQTYPQYSDEPKNSKVCIVLSNEKTPSLEMQNFLKGLKLEEVIA